MRLEGKVAVIVGAGQSPGEGIGNGRATTLRFAQEGARILAVDRLIASAEATDPMARAGSDARGRGSFGSLSEQESAQAGQSLPHRVIVVDDSYDGCPWQLRSPIRTRNNVRRASAIALAIGYVA
jgi:NAD(P)-dependent dehydrogenase (short-subunit alcohol dehydrogenase family)